MNSASESSDGNAGCGDPLPHASKARDGKDVLFECRVVDITELEFSSLLSLKWRANVRVGFGSVYCTPLVRLDRSLHGLRQMQI